MAEHLTEEEQLEALRRWWKENGKSMLIGVVVAVVIYFAWVSWSDHKREQAEAGSLIFQDLVEAITVEPGETVSAEKRTSVLHLADQLKNSYSNSIYAKNAALFMAKLFVQNDELDKAGDELSWVLQQNPSDGIEILTKLRLARVYKAQARYDESLALLEGGIPASFESAAAEVRGDVYMAQTLLQEARAAYKLALDKMPAEQSARRPLLQMKLDDLKTSADELISAVEDS